MAEEVTKYTVSVGFENAIKNVNKFINRMSKMEQGREAALRRQIKLQRQLNGLRGGGGSTRGGGGTSGGGGSQRKGKAGLKGGFFDLGLEKVNNKAAGTLFAEQMKEAEASAQKALKSQEARNAALNKQKINAKRVVSLLEMESDVQAKATAATIKERIAKAQTADEVRDIVAQERKNLQLQRRKTKQAERQNFLLRRMRSSSEQIAGNMASAFAVGATGAFITKTGQDFEAVNNTMLAVSSNSKEAGENFGFVRDEAFRLGLGLKQSAQGFAKMIAAQGTLSKQDIRTIFTGVSELGTVLGLSAEEAGRATNAITQMLSKGKISAEELN